MVAIEFDDYTEQLCSFIESLPPPRAIIVVSAHWVTGNGVRITASQYPKQIYDFHGFPDTLYALTYPCVGDPKLAEEIAILLGDAGFNTVLDSERGLDHGTWVPLYVTFPNVDVPVIQISIPIDGKPEDLLRMGNALADLRKHGIMLVGSGNLVHNLKLIKSDDKYAEPENWAEELDNWFALNLANQDLKKLLAYESNAPHLSKGIPTNEHLLPIYFVLGAMRQKDHYVRIFDGFHYANISMRCFAFV